MRPIYFFLTFGLAVGMFLGRAPGEASELRHSFINPNFGGSPFNGQPLLNSATLQNDFQEGQGIQTRSPLDDFRDRLNRSVLNELSQDIISRVFGEEGVSPGTFEAGDFNIVITEDLDGVTVSITDQATGDFTSVTVPFF